MKRTISVYPAAPLLAFLIFAVSALLIPGNALAIPAFARHVGRDCTYCHIQIPKLNETGRTFRQNGFRFEDEGEWDKARDLSSAPVSVEVEVEASYDNVRASGVKSTESDLVIEEVELLAGGAFGKTGRVSAYGAVSVGQTSTGYTTVLHNAYIQVNDLVGPTGGGRLNLKAGKSSMSLPFLGDDKSVMGARYLAESELNLFTRGQRIIELNGMAINYDEESLKPTHRYFVGVTREDVNADHKLAGWYAQYVLTFKEAVSVGAIYRGGEEALGAVDANFNRYGIAGEAEAGDFVFTGGFFSSDKSGSAVLKDYLIEALYIPTPRLTFGARAEMLKEDGKKGALSHNYMLRYNILTSAFVQLEYRGLKDDDHATGANEKETRLRLFLTAVF